MFSMKLLRKKFILTSLSAIILCVFMSSTVLAAAPSIHLSSPCPSDTDALFTVKGENVYFDCSVSDNPKSVELIWPSKPWSKKVALTKVANTNGLYEVTTGNNYDYKAKGREFKQFEIKATNGNGSTSVFRNYAVLAFSSNDAYKTVAPNLSWSYPDVTPFVYPKSDDYNCVAYAMDVYDQWMQCNSSDFDANGQIKVDKLDEYMFKTGAYTSRPGTQYSQRVSSNEFPTVVYYRNYHFAKVLSWNSNGTPRSTQSKWGQAEVVNTYGYNVYTYDSYGYPDYYYK